MIVGTAGHIDHGKSALVTALTGHPVDRLHDERRRGITIDLNFAPLDTADGPPIGIVDVPGHEDFVRTMVAGATGIDLVLFVVDLAEGPRPQTEEHLAIVEQLRIPRGIPVFTKADLAEPEWIELVVADVAARLARSPVRFAEPAVVSALTGQGIPQLRRRLLDEAARAAERSPDDLFRLPIDRAFSLPGVGTVVTGTSWSGSVGIGDRVQILPAGIEARIRSIETFGNAASRTVPGTRTALGLVGVDRHVLARGNVVVDLDAGWTATRLFDAELELLDTAPRPITARTRIRIHAGTAEVLGRVYPRGAIGPGARGLARIRLESPAVLRGEDRLVIRSFSPVATIGGGRVLDPDPAARAAWPVRLGSSGDAHVAALVERRPAGLLLARLPLVSGLTPAAAQRIASGAVADIIRLGDRLLDAARVEALERAVVDRVNAHHVDAPDEAGPSLEILRRGLPGGAAADVVLARLEASGRLRVSGGTAAVPGFTPRLEGGDEAFDKMVDLLRRAALEPPTVDELEDILGVAVGPLVRRGVSEGALVAVTRDRYFFAPALQQFVQTVSQIGSEHAITPAALRDRLRLSRKYLIPLLEWTDRQGVTRRQGDIRILVRAAP